MPPGATPEPVALAEQNSLLQQSSTGGSVSQDSMDDLAGVCEQVGKFSGRLRKVSILADFFQGLSDEDLVLAVRFLSTGPLAEAGVHQTLFGTQEKPRLSVGYATMRKALLEVCGWDIDTVRLCYQEVGDSGETIGLLIRGHSSEQPLSLAQANDLYQEIFRARLTARKVRLLADAFRTYRPLTIKYIVKVITGNLRVGLQQKMVEEALAAACGLPLETIRDASNRLGDLAGVALAARTNTIQDIRAQLFHPLEFMLAKPLDHIEDLPSPRDWFVEDKYDGIRSQIHIDRGHIRIYSRGMEELTNAFPELVKAFVAAPLTAILDGEILAWREGRALNFNILQQRIARKTVKAALMLEIPVLFVAYDILLLQNELALAKPFEERRSLLAETVEQMASVSSESRSRILLSPHTALEDHEQLERMFLEARGRGNEGLIVKRRGSVYEAGKRSGSWFKIKRPYGTLDVVITAAEQGHGRRATVFSDYTFGVCSGDGFVNIGKAYSGLTDTEIKQLTKLLRSLSLERFGRVMLVRPEVVLEVAFDGVQKSARHKSGYALRFPRILRWRHDKAPHECDDLARVRELYESSLR
jgi:DNA ligase-1